MMSLICSSRCSASGGSLRYMNELFSSVSCPACCGAGGDQQQTGILRAAPCRQAHGDQNHDDTKDTKQFTQSREVAIVG